MVAIREELPNDAAARERLLDAVFGAARFAKSCERLRHGRLPAEGLSLVADMDGTLCGTVRLWHVAAGGAGPALLLGPLAVDPACQGRGVGTALVDVALDRAAALGHGAVLLMGDPGYYRRFGFSAARTGGLVLPGDDRLFLARELRAGMLAGASGVVEATGAIPLRTPAAAPVTLPRAA
jgi:predicted N-acetyltransferase YhbS